MATREFDPEFDTVIAGGRVIDPETGLDAVRSVGIRGGSIASISDADLPGERILDARGLVVTPASSICTTTPSHCPATASRRSTA